jgi:CRISPR-associated protein Csb3
MITLACNVLNPGHFFACCGLMELAYRLDGTGVRAVFRTGAFEIDCSSDLADVVNALRVAPVSTVSGPAIEDGEEQEEAGKASPLLLGGPFGLRLDWWSSPRAKDLKVWAGTMDGPSIFRSMIKAIPSEPSPILLEHRAVVADVEDAKKKKEPFYFDARRGEHADPRDVGFSPNDQGMRTAASPAVEALTLIGLQRFRPRPDPVPRLFTYRAWAIPVPIMVASAAVATDLAGVPTTRFRFESTFRTSQRKHKAFTMATELQGARQ